ncbi:MAG TPA: helicase-related protein, partial [Rhodanobacteraceae bacterium]|nr:helicase-related protein [Rhodanobacteraceae bacterium]
IDTLERVEILRDLRRGAFDVLVGINLLREGLDLPEVSLVAILDADKEGFLRSTGSLIQTIGRCARNVRGKAILYGDTVTRSMQAAIDETDRRRARQVEYNLEHGITPTTIVRDIADVMEGAREDPSTRGRGRSRGEGQAAAQSSRKVAEEAADYATLDAHAAGALIKKLEARMYKHAQDLEFEEAARLRDEIHRVREQAFLS